MSDPSEAPVFLRNRPYFDLGISPEQGPLYTRGLELGYEHLEDVSTSSVGSQANLPESFRKEVILETGLIQYGLRDPRQLSTELRTERWENVCGLLDGYHDLQPIAQLRLANLLARLTLHQAVVEQVPKFSNTEIASDSVVAALAFRRALSQLSIDLESTDSYNRDDFLAIAEYAPDGSIPKLNAALQALAQDAKRQGDLAGVDYLADTAMEQLNILDSSLDDFTNALLNSISQRALSFLPLLRGDYAEMVRQMDQCEEMAEKLFNICSSAEQEFAAYENLTIVFQSRCKEALILGDFQLAEDRARGVAQRDPYDPIYLQEWGDTLIKLKKIEEAAVAYDEAVSLGPPRKTNALLMSGQCHEVLGDLKQAVERYTELNELGTRLIDPGLSRWSQERLTALQGKIGTAA